MGLRVNTNVAAIGAQRYLGQSSRALEQSLKALSSGNRFEGSTSNAVEKTMADRLSAQAKALGAIEKTTENASSYFQIAQGSLNEQNNILIRLRELGIQSASDTVAEEERGLIDFEVQELAKEFDRIAATTTFNGVGLLNGDSDEMEFQVGVNDSEHSVITYNSNINSTASELGIDSISAADKGDARSSLETIDQAINKVGQYRAQLGAIDSRMSYTNSSVTTQKENIIEARSRLADTDVAETTAEVQKQQVMVQYQLAALSNAQRFPESTLRLIA